MGDMREIFDAMKEFRLERRAKRLSEAKEIGWQKHTEHHWFRVINGTKLNYWPSSGLVMIGNRRHNINSKHIQAMLAATKEKGE